MEDQVDDFYFSVLSDSSEQVHPLPICDEKYADELQLQEVLLSCLIAAKKIKAEQPETSSTRKVKMKIEQAAGQSACNIKKEPAAGLPTGPSSIKSSEPMLCKICMEESRALSDVFLNLNCSHTFCTDCLNHYIGSKIQENISAVKCPEEGCKGLIEPENCQGFIPKQVFERWGSALCEAMVLGSNKFTYCPFKDCSALLQLDDDDDDDDDDEEGAVIIVQSECPSCRRMFCAKCEAAWHAGLSCDEYQRLGVDERGKEDLKLFEIAKSKKWMRCPNCRFYVEKTQGCLHVTCRCTFQFCYGCGKKWSDTHASCIG